MCVVLVFNMKKVINAILGGIQNLELIIFSEELLFCELF